MLSRRIKLIIPVLTLLLLVLAALQLFISPPAVSAQQASAIALGAVPGGTVVEVSSGSERGRETREVLILKPDGSGVEIYIDAITGDILKQENVPAADMQDAGIPAEDMPAEANVSGSPVSAQQANTIALGAVPEGTVVEVSSGLERGRTTWEVLILRPDGSGVEIYIDAITGDILKQESVPAADMQDAGIPAEDMPAEAKYDDYHYVDYEDDEDDKVHKVDKDDKVDKVDDRGGSRKSEEQYDE